MHQSNDVGHCNKPGKNAEAKRERQRVRETAMSPQRPIRDTEPKTEDIYIWSHGTDRAKNDQAPRNGTSGECARQRGCRNGVRDDCGHTGLRSKLSDRWRERARKPCELFYKINVDFAAASG